jgi:23S rRNA (cytosine1962-C5)-methyltransferase
MKQSNIQITKSSADYELLDCGNGEKLERFGKYILRRPDPQALWQKRLDDAEWKKADARFTRDDDNGNGDSKSGWIFKKDLDDKWKIDLANLKFIIKPTAFKHVGIFPEQSQNWTWLDEKVKNALSQEANKTDGVEVLNLFGYTGGASLVCAKAGAKVVHIDGSKSAITWGKENAEISDLVQKPIRWILDDARTFVTREIKRERKYDGIIMDPPAFGHGPENELWKIEEHFVNLVSDCFKIMKEKPSFFLINGYSAGYSAIAYENILLQLIEKFGGTVEIGELAIEEVKIEGKYRRLLPAGIFARWSAK